MSRNEEAHAVAALYISVQAESLPSATRMKGRSMNGYPEDMYAPRDPSFVRVVVSWRKSTHDRGTLSSLVRNAFHQRAGHPERAERRVECKPDKDRSARFPWIRHSLKDGRHRYSSPLHAIDLIA